MDKAVEQTATLTNLLKLLETINQIILKGSAEDHENDGQIVGLLCPRTTQLKEYQDS